MRVKPSKQRSSPDETRDTLSPGQIRPAHWFILTVIMAVLLVETDIVAAAPEICDNKIDDDGDFATDCNDLDCAGAAGCPCMDIQAVPVVKRMVNKVLTIDFPGTVTLRQNICQSAGCTFENAGTADVLGDDRCMGPGRNCPTVTIDQRSTSSANTGRSNVCQSANCYFSDSGESDEPIVVYNYVGDDCSPYYQDGRRYRQSDGSTCQGIWSYLPEEDQSKPPPADSNGARRVGCCSPSLARCVNDLGTCFNFEEVDSTAATLICGEANNWDKCGAALKVNNVNTLPGTFSDGRNHICRFIEGLFYGWLVVPDEDCDNLADDDFDSLVDCTDPYCYGRAGPGGALCPTPETMCMDGADNDGDGLADCKDSDCDNLLAFSTGTEDFICEYGTETRCTDNYDNDWDGLVDCSDSDCRSASACPEILCTDGLDNDADWGTLRAYYPFDGNVEDVSGNNYHGNIIGSTSVVNCAVEGITAQSCYFVMATVTSYISLPAEVMDGLNDFYVDFWMKTSHPNDAIISAANTDEDDEFLIMHSGASGQDILIWVKNQNFNYVGSDLIINDNLWHHVIVSRDGDTGEVSLIIDDVPRTLTVPPTLPTGPLSVDSGGLIIGQEQDSLGGTFDFNQAYQGQIDELRIYDYKWGGGTDCIDSDCQSPTVVDSCTIGGTLFTETGPATGMLTYKEVNCANTFDDDRDGRRDCADPDCAGRDGSTLEAGDQLCQVPESICTDGFDNDGDTFTDCADPGCAGQMNSAGQTCCQSDDHCGSPNTCQVNVCTAGDSDGDGIPDDIDNCPSVSNPDQLDTDGDRQGDACDTDDDDDEISDDIDQCANTPAGEPVDELGCSDSQRDSDGDGIVDSIDTLACRNTPIGLPVYPVGSPNAGCQLGDINKNGCIDLPDWNIFLGLIGNYFENTGYDGPGDLTDANGLDLGDWNMFLYAMGQYFTTC